MSGWRQVSLGDVIDVFDHIRVPLSAEERSTRKGVYPYYGAQSIIDHIDGYLLDGRYILIPEDGENLNSRKLPIAYFATGKFWVNNQAHIIRGAYGKADDVFLKHAIEAADIKGYITGAAQPKLTQANLRRIQIALPDLTTQTRIASILGAYDDLIEVNWRRIAVLEAMARDLFEEWFVRFRFPGHEGVEIVESYEGRRPAGWAIGSAGDIILFDPRTKVSSTGEKPFIDMGSLDTSTSIIAGFTWRSGNSGSKFMNGDTLFARITPCLQNGKTGIVRALPSEEGIGFGSTEFIVMRPGRAGSAFIYCLARYEAFRSHAEGGMAGASGRQRARTESVASFPISIAAPDSEIYDAFERVAWPMLQLVGELGSANGRLAAARDLLLPRLISGELSVAAAERQLEDAA